MFDFIEVENVEIETPVQETKNLHRCFFDLECTLRAKDGDIIQMAAIITDWDFNIIGVYSEYYKNEVPIRPEEFRIHGITQDLIDSNATRHFTEAIPDTPFNKYNESLMYVTYSTFDIGRVNDELRKHGVETVDFGQEVSTMATDIEDKGRCHFNAYRLGQKKGELVAKELGEQAFDSIYKELENFGDFEIKGSHDALYDTVMMLALCRRKFQWENS